MSLKKILKVRNWNYRNINLLDLCKKEV